MRKLMPVGAGLLLIMFALGSWGWAAWIAVVVVVVAGVLIAVAASRGRHQGG